MLWERFSKTEKVLGVTILLLVVVLAFFILRGGQRDDGGFSSNSPINFSDQTSLVQEEQVQSESTESAEPTEPIMVDVKGAVKKPGVYVMDSGERVNDAIRLAGGFLTEADPNQVNLAEVVVDEMVIYVPKVGEEPLMTVAGDSEEEGKVNLNEADSADLETIPGIGPSKAKAILDYREESGPFQKIEDITNVPGIGEKTLERIRDYISVSK